MKSQYIESVLFGICIIASQSSYAETYFTSEQIQKALYPSATRFEQKIVNFDKGALKKIEDSSPTSTPVPDKYIEVYEGDKFLGYIVIDKVLGKHEFITYAVAISKNGEIKQIEIMEYLESYGHQIRNEKWRAQFNGKKFGDPLKLTKDIENISGATLSCKHITEGIRRITSLFEYAIKKI